LKIVRDTNGDINTWKLAGAIPSALKAWKMTKEQVLGKTTNEIVGLDATMQFPPLIKGLFKTGQAKKRVNYFEPTNQYLSMSSVPFGEYFITTGDVLMLKKKQRLRL